MKHGELIESLAQEFELSFLVTGLTPVNRRFGDGSSDGCLVTALDVSEHGNSAPASFREELEHDTKRIERVRDHLRARFPCADEDWWTTFVQYLILSYDQRATCPRGWLRRTWQDEFTLAVSPRLMGAAVGGILRYRLLVAKPVQELAAVPAPAPRPARKRQRRAVLVA